jgi:hypothetical protein
MEISSTHSPTMEGMAATAEEMRANELPQS